ncbi:MAG: hypothetical protein E7404_05725 [Ruminococcaceae bacterium]|nr:hypothetical protein [Oscillospiraceae bacterium]
MNVTFFHKTKQGYVTKVFKGVKVRILNEADIFDGSNENKSSAVIRIFTKENYGIFTLDRCVFYATDEKEPPKESFAVKSVHYNTNGILSHIKVECVC